MRIMSLLIAVVFLSSCATKPVTHTQVPSLKYAKSYVSDAKEGVSRASKTRDEIDADIKKLLESSE